MASFCAVLFPLDVLDEIWDVIESVSESFLTYFLTPSNYYWPSQGGTLVAVIFVYVRCFSKFYCFNFNTFCVSNLFNTVKVTQIATCSRNSC